MSSKDSSARLDDIALVRRIVAGERELFRSIVEAHEATIYRMIRRQVNNQTTARDLTQETFLRAYRGLAQFRGSATMRTWLIRIALNVTMSFFSSRLYKEMSRTDADAEQERIPQPDPETDPYTESELRALRHGIASLKEIYREVIVLCGLEGKTYQEASEILGIPLGTVCSRMNSANHQLRIKLKRVRR